MPALAGADQRNRARRRPRRDPVRVAGLVALLAATTFVTAVVLATPAPAEAHPFGDPQTVAIALDPQRPDVVHVRWKVGGLDDLTVLGIALGLLPPDRIMMDGAVFFQASDATTIGPSDPFAAYLRKRITVASGGRDCAGTVTPPSDLARSGVTVDYTCPGPVGTATVAVRMLTDLNPAYQTLAIGPDNKRAVYGSGQDSHDWILGDAPAANGADLGRRAAVQIAGVIGALALATIVGLVASRQFRRRRRAAG